MDNETYAVIKLSVRHGKLSLIRDIRANSKMVNTIYIDIEFKSEEWQEFSKVVVFSRNDIEPIAIRLQDTNRCTIPWEILDAGENDTYPVTYTVGILGIGENNKRLPTNSIELTMNKGCYNATVDGRDPTPDIFTELRNEIDRLPHYSEEEIQAISREELMILSESGTFNGSDGYTPIKGIDYFTSSDKKEIVNMVIEDSRVQEQFEFDTVIRSQEEFNAAYSANHFAGCKRILLACDIVKTGTVHLHQDVELFDGGGHTLTFNLLATGSASYFLKGDENSIPALRNIKIAVHASAQNAVAARYAKVVHKFAGVDNVRVTVDGTIAFSNSTSVAHIYCFDGCDNLTNCKATVDVTITGGGTQDVVGYYSCRFQNRCRFDTDNWENNHVISTAFYLCENITNGSCYKSLYGFRQCKNIVNSEVQKSFYSSFLNCVGIANCTVDDTPVSGSPFEDCQTMVGGIISSDDLLTLDGDQTIAGKKTLATDKALCGEAASGSIYELLKFYSTTNCPVLGDTRLYNLGRPLVVLQHFVPSSPSEIDLGKQPKGSEDRRFRDLYLSRNLTDGANEITIKNIVEMYDYLKANLGFEGNK